MRLGIISGQWLILNTNFPCVLVLISKFSLIDIHLLIIRNKENKKRHVQSTKLPDTL